MAKSAEKREFFGAKILPELKQAIEILADEDDRSASNVAERILLAWFREHRPDLLPPNF
jgi:hypothetical protein